VPLEIVVTKCYLYIDQFTSQNVQLRELAYVQQRHVSVCYSSEENDMMLMRFACVI